MYLHCFTCGIRNPRPSIRFVICKEINFGPIWIPLVPNTCRWQKIVRKPPYIIVSDNFQSKADLGNDSLVSKYIYIYIYIFETYKHSNSVLYFSVETNPTYFKKMSNNIRNSFSTTSFWAPTSPSIAWKDASQCEDHSCFNLIGIGNDGASFAAILLFDKHTKA